jgi:hypothetical protein
MSNRFPIYFKSMNVTNDFYLIKLNMTVDKKVRNDDCMKVLIVAYKENEALKQEIQELKEKLEILKIP